MQSNFSIIPVDLIKEGNLIYEQSEKFFD